MVESLFTWRIGKNGLYRIEWPKERAQKASIGATPNLAVKRSDADALDGHQGAGKCELHVILTSSACPNSHSKNSQAKAEVCL